MATATKVDALMTPENLAWAVRVGRAKAKRLPPSFDVADLEQAARIGLWKAAAKYDARLNDSFRGFASRYVQGEVMMSVRRRHYVEATHEELSASVAGGESPEDACARRQARRREIDRAHALLQRLPSRERRALRLVYLEEVPVRELARRLALSEAAAYALVRHAALMARGLEAA